MPNGSVGILVLLLEPLKAPIASLLLLRRGFIVSSAESMQSFLKSLGIDPDNLKWQDLASCKKLKTKLFFDEYESSTVIDKQIDSICASCPVIKECYDFFQSKKETGVFGGFYLINGQV